MAIDNLYNITICDLMIDMLESGEILSQKEYNYILRSIDSEFTRKRQGITDILPIYCHVQYIKLVSLLHKDSCNGLLEASKYILEARKQIELNNKELLRGMKITSNNLIRDNIYTLAYQSKEVEKYIENFVDFGQEYVERMEDFRPDFTHPIGTNTKVKMEESVQKIKQFSKEYITRK